MPKKGFLLLGLCLALMLPIESNMQKEGQIINWISTLKTAEDYFSYPSTENALQFYNNLPVFLLGHEEIKDRENFLKLIDCLDKNIPILSREMDISDRNAVKLAFRLRNISDGSLSESLDAALGDSIRINPKLFLEELLSSPNREYLEKIGYPVTSGGLYYVGQWPQVERYELEMRLKALNQVKDPDLLGIRDICITMIKSELRRITGL